MSDSNVYGSDAGSKHVLITAPEAARLAQVSPQAIRRACGQQRVPGAKRDDHGHWLIPRLAAEQWGSSEGYDGHSVAGANRADTATVGADGYVDVTDRTVGDRDPGSSPTVTRPTKHPMGIDRRAVVAAELAGLRAEVDELRAGTFTAAEVLRVRAENVGLRAQVAALIAVMGEGETTSTPA